MGYRDREGFQQKVYQPPITRVCTTIRNETIASFYSLNTFVIWDGDERRSDMLTFNAWTWAIGSAHSRNLRHLYVYTDTPYLLKTYLKSRFTECEHKTPVEHRHSWCDLENEWIHFHLTFATEQGIVLQRVSDDMELCLHNCWRQHKGLRPVDRIEGDSEGNSDVDSDGDSEEDSEEYNEEDSEEYSEDSEEHSEEDSEEHSEGNE